jgi:hypothetical protein
MLKKILVAAAFVAAIAAPAFAQSFIGGGSTDPAAYATQIDSSGSSAIARKSEKSAQAKMDQADGMPHEMGTPVPHT